jgi:membrane protease YdiL (CAAX protease family)
VLTLFAAFMHGSIALALIPMMGGSSASLFALSGLVAYGGAFAMGATRVPEPPGPNLGFRAPPPQAWLAVPFLLCGVLIVSEVDNVFRELVPPPEQLAQAEPPAGFTQLAEWLLAFALVMPLVEEVFFRGLLLPGLTRAWGSYAGIGFMALLSGIATALTAGPWALAYAAAAAVLLGLLRMSSGSVLPGMLLGCALGLLGVLATRDSFGIPGFDDTSVPHTPIEYLAPAALALGVGLALCRASARTRSRKSARS